MLIRQTPRSIRITEADMTMLTQIHDARQPNAHGAGMLDLSTASPLVVMIEGCLISKTYDLLT
jgi:hypothetical protein